MQFLSIPIDPPPPPLTCISPLPPLLVLSSSSSHTPPSPLWAANPKFTLPSFPPAPTTRPSFPSIRSPSLCIPFFSPTGGSHPPPLSLSSRSTRSLAPSHVTCEQEPWSSHHQDNMNKTNKMIPKHAWRRVQSLHQWVRIEASTT